MSEDLVSIATAAVAAAKDIPADIDAAEAAGEVVGTQEPDAPAGDEGTTAAAVADADAVDPAAVAKPAEPAKPAEEDAFATEHELKTKDSMGRENRIPYSRVRKIADNAVAKATVPLQQEVTRLANINQNVAQFEHLLVNDAHAAVEVLGRINPEFKKLFRGAAEPATPAVPVTPAPTELDFSKAPPADTADGYSPVGLQKLLAWTAQESAAIATAKAVAEAEARIGERYKPLEQTYKQQKERQEYDEQLANYTNSTLADAGQWKHFKDFEGEILKAMQEDSAQAAKPGGKLKYNGRTALRQAYEDVVFGKITTDRQKQREEILAELNKAPRTTAAATSRTGAPAPAESDGPITNLTLLEQVARDAINQHRGR